MRSTATTLAAIFGYAAAQQTYGAPPTGATPTASCPAAGATATDGRYSCNPAHQYPENQFCLLSDGCYYLVNQGPGVSATASPTASATASPTPTPSCPAPGTNGTDGRYSCNPAHQYPQNQFCLLSDGCYYLVNQGPGVSVSAAPTAVLTTVCPSPTTITYGGSTYAITSATTLTITSCPGGCTAPPPAPTSACPAPGATDSQGRYSCNPAHSYPAGQTCVLNNSCYFLVTSSSSSSAMPSTTARGNVTTPTSLPPQYTGAAVAFATAAPVMAVAALGALFL